MDGIDLTSEHTDISRADVLLITIPLVFVGIYTVGMFAVDSRVLRASVASLACCLVIADGLWVHPPEE